MHEAIERHGFSEKDFTGLGHEEYLAASSRVVASRDELEELAALGFRSGRGRRPWSRGAPPKEANEAREKRVTHSPCRDRPGPSWLGLRGSYTDGNER